MGLRQRLVLLLELAEQPDVLNRDDRLVGEGLERRDLLVRERPDLGAADWYGADRDAMADKGHDKDCSRPPIPNDRRSFRIFPSKVGVECVMNMYRPTFEDRAATRRS